MKRLLALALSLSASSGAFAALFIPDHAVTQKKLAIKPTSGTSVVAGGIAVSASTGSFTTTSASGNVTNASVTIVSTGRPVMVMLQNDGTGSNSGFTGVLLTRTSATTPVTQPALAQLTFSRDSGAAISTGAISVNANGTTNNSSQLPCTSFAWLDVTPAAGSHTYATTYINWAGTQSLGVSNCVLVAFEI